MKKLKGPRRLPVANPRNSECGSAPLADLDWSRWWIDTSFNQFYLHVAHTAGETWHRVYCRKSNSPRLEMHAGALLWIVDAPKATEAQSDAQG